MIFLIKEPPTLGRPRFAERLASHLELPPPVWPISEGDLQEWQESLFGWPEADVATFTTAGFLSVDFAAGLLMMQEKQNYPPPPTSEAGSRDGYESWRDAVMPQFMRDHFDKVMGMVVEMVESQRHIILDGNALGTSPRDTPLSMRLQAHFVGRPIFRALLKVPEGEAPGEEASEHVAVIDTRQTFTQTELLSQIRRSGSNIELDPSIQSARTRVPELAL